jgi:hypothetical protein
VDLKGLFRKKSARPVGEPRAIERLLTADGLVREDRIAEAVGLYLAEADSHAKNDRYAQAVRLVEKALAADPENMEAAERLARLERVRATLSRRDRIVDLMNNRMNQGTFDSRLTPRELHEYWPGVGGSPLIADLSDDQLGRLFDVMEVRRWGIQTVLARQGQHQAQSHLIVHGTVEAVLATSTGDSRVLLLFGPGDFIGDSLLLGNGQLQASYRTGSEETTALRLTRRGLNQALEGAVDPQSVLDAIGRHGRDREIAALLG